MTDQSQFPFDGVIEPDPLPVPESKAAASTVKVDDEAGFPTAVLDPDVAVDRVLVPMQRQRFVERRLVGGFDGAAPADWLAQAQDEDFGVGLTDPWLEEHGETATAQLAAVHGLPVSYCRRLIVSALYAFLGLDWTKDTLQRTSSRDLVLELAGRAAVWSRGYAEATGWTPPEVQ